MANVHHTDIRSVSLEMVGDHWCTTRTMRSLVWYVYEIAFRHIDRFRARKTCRYGRMQQAGTLTYRHNTSGVISPERLSAAPANDDATRSGSQTSNIEVDVVASAKEDRPDLLS